MKLVHKLFGGPLDGAVVREDPRSTPDLYFDGEEHTRPGTGQTKLTPTYRPITLGDVGYRWHPPIDRYVFLPLFEDEKAQ